MKALAIFLCLIAAVGAQWGAIKSPPSCSCGNHYEKEGTMKNFDSNPFMKERRKYDQMTRESALVELEDDRVCAKCARDLAKIEQLTVSLDSFDFYIK